MAMRPMANSFIHVNGSRKTMNPTSNTSAVDVPPITNVDVTFKPLEYADNVNKSAQAAASPTTIGVNAGRCQLEEDRVRGHRESREERERQIVRHSGQYGSMRLARLPSTTVSRSGRQRPAPECPRHDGRTIRQVLQGWVSKLYRQVVVFNR